MSNVNKLQRRQRQHEIEQLSDLDKALGRTQGSPEYKSFFKRFPLGSIWKWNKFNTLDPIINSGRPYEDRLLAVQRTELFAVNASIKETQEGSFVEWSRILNNRFPDWKSRAIQESQYYAPELTFTRDGVRYSLDFMKKILVAGLALKAMGGPSGPFFSNWGVASGRLAQSCWRSPRPANMSRWIFLSHSISQQYS